MDNPDVNELAQSADPKKEDELVLAEASIIEGCECSEVKPEEIEEMKTLGEKMINYCAVNGGLGLAAPQVGVMKRMFVWANGPNTFQIVLNPSFFPEKKTTNTVEGCLSYPGKQFYMKRFKEGNAKFFIKSIKEEGTLQKAFKKLSREKAFIFQHELDHLNGKTISTEGELLSWDAEAEDGK